MLLHAAALLLLVVLAPLCSITVREALKTSPYIQALRLIYSFYNDSRVLYLAAFMS